MSLRDLDIKVEYRNLDDDMVNDFYLPLLKEAILYKRAVGFFSSNILISIIDGIQYLIKNGGRIELIASPKLSEEDYEAIKKGYAEKEEIINKKLKEELIMPNSDYEKNRYNILANLIAQGYLDIKIAMLESNNNYGIYHEKLGIFLDSDSNKVVFTGSMNETDAGLHLNYETIDIFCSWKDSYRTTVKNDAFDRIWSGTEKNIKTYEIKDVKKEIIKKYKLNDVDFKNIDLLPIKEIHKQSFFVKPDNIVLYPYQEEAIEKWFNNGCRGIFDMATGTGKTITALSAISQLSEKLKENLAVIIVVPYQHLVEQWCEDIEKFNVFNYVKAYSFPEENWRKEFKNKVNAYNLGVLKNFCVITTNASFKLNDFQDRILKIKKDYVIIGDEAHNFGSRNLYKALPENATYRLGLSATINRHHDEEGTDLIKKYFGAICITYTIKEAIKNGFLTEYYYYPIINYFSPEELYLYYDISLEIKQKLALLNNKYIEGDNPALDALYAKRSRIVAGCKDKVNNLFNLLIEKEYINKYNILIYCGATKFTIDDNENNNETEVRQIEHITKKLGVDLGMKVRTFTSRENKNDRKEIIKMFINKEIQSIIAIKCLDEGVNVPSINTAFILASSTNPKEYIQRRGRVLRKSKGKHYAVIYDFITIPRNKDLLTFAEDWQIEIDKSLIRNEIIRMNDFKDACNNKIDTEELKQKIKELYGEYYGL